MAESWSPLEDRPVAFGSFAFDPASGDSVVIVPRHVVGRRDGRAWLTTIGDAPGPATRPMELAEPPAAPSQLRPGRHRPHHHPHVRDLIAEHELQVRSRTAAQRAG